MEQVKRSGCWKLAEDTQSPSLFMTSIPIQWSSSRMFVILSTGRFYLEIR